MRFGMGSIRFCVLALLALATAFTGAAAEIPRGPLGGAYMELTAEDHRLLRRATARLLQTGGPGSVISWQNDQSGNFGTIKLEDSFRAFGLPCKRVDHILQFRNESDPRLVRLTFCNEGGEWKLVG